MRVVPRNDSQGWVFLEPTKDVFLGSTVHLEDRSFTSADNSLPIHNEFHIDLCEDMGQLVQAYFRRFKIQGLVKPWLAFAGGWRTPSLSKYFGLDPTLVVGDYRYMLVRVLMVRNSGNAVLLPNVTYNREYAEHVDHFRTDGDQAMYHFTNNVGTHYVSNSLIQGYRCYTI
jgi:torso-like protein